MHALLILLMATASAQKVPRRQIPPEVLAELSQVQNRFELALAQDCADSRCFSRGCSYVDHAVIDRPRGSSLPGLGDAAGPGSIEPQSFLTRARCSFAHEPTVTAEEAGVLVRRMQSKSSMGFVVVSVERQALSELPPHLREADNPVVEEPEEEEPIIENPEEPWGAALAVRELWTTLLPHFAWMIAVGMLTVAATILMWAYRRVGRESFEERAMLAELERGVGGAPDPEEAEASEEAETDRAFAIREAAAWGLKLEEAENDPQLQALVRDLLRSGDMPLLAKAVLLFPDTFLASFPTGGDIASAKLELAEYLRTADLDELPSEPDFFRMLNRHARSASLAAQSDAALVRSLREDFGAAGLVDLIRGLPPRSGAVLFALAPTDEQYEMTRLLSEAQMADLSEQLLRSNRIDDAQSAYLFEVLAAAKEGGELPAPPRFDVSDRGTAFDAAGALSVLLSRLSKQQRAALFGEAVRRFSGSLPAWYRGILVADMLFELSEEARADLMLEVDVETLAAWLSLQDASVRSLVLARLPGALANSVEASSGFESRVRQLALAERGRRDLALGFQAQLVREGIPFERIVQPPAPSPRPEEL